jgi:hypothetical protein
VDTLACRVRRVSPCQGHGAFVICAWLLLSDMTVGDARFFFIGNDIFYGQSTFNKTDSSMIVFFTSLNKVCFFIRCVARET